MKVIVLVEQAHDLCSRRHPDPATGRSASTGADLVVDEITGRAVEGALTEQARSDSPVVLGTTGRRRMEHRSRSAVAP